MGPYSVALFASWIVQDSGDCAACIEAARAKCEAAGFGQAFEGIAQILMAGTDSVMHAMELYTKRAWVLRAWQDVFVDLVQGQLQQLFLSLLSRKPLPVVDGMREQSSLGNLMLGTVCAGTGGISFFVRLVLSHQHP